MPSITGLGVHEDDVGLELGASLRASAPFSASRHVEARIIEKEHLSPWRTTAWSSAITI